jgi:meso-butanediol dehydrogenase/(S,S)-butanediol dehydrogenase/diacetyl reductase
MPGRLQDKVAVITGGGSGIGRAACLLFAREGAKVAVVDKDSSAAKAVSVEAGANALALTADVASSESVKEMLQKVLAHYGRIDVLVNNAGYGIAGTVVDTDEADWAALMAVNVNGVFYGCKHAIPIMRRNGGGVIVNTASVVATVGIRNRAAYCASKGAIAALTKAMAVDHVADNIRVNCIAPGTIDTPYFEEMLQKSGRAAELKSELEGRQAMNRLGKPEEIAYGMLYLACDESSFATGSMLTVDGGMTAQCREGR